jgi:hypothetical protein
MGKGREGKEGGKGRKEGRKEGEGGREGNRAGGRPAGCVPKIIVALLLKRLATPAMESLLVAIAEIFTQKNQDFAIMDFIKI